MIGLVLLFSFYQELRLVGAIAALPYPSLEALPRYPNFQGLSLHPWLAIHAGQAFFQDRVHW
jgi:hypothetical protein